MQNRVKRGRRLLLFAIEKQRASMIFVIMKESMNQRRRS
jgi:hypothetical protein